MKKNYFKKSLSLVLTVLMLMSCWVFVAPTESEAVDAGASVAEYNKQILNGLNTNVTVNLTTTTNNKYQRAGEGDTKTADATPARLAQSYQNVLNFNNGNIVTTGTESAAYFSGVANADSVQVWYPDTVLMYDGATTPKMAILIEIDSNGKELRSESCWFDGATGFTLGVDASNPYWKGSSTDDSATMYCLYLSGTGNIATTNGTSGSAAYNHKAWLFSATHLMFTGTMGDTEWVRTFKPTWYFKGGNKSSVQQYSVSSGNVSKTIYVMNVKGYTNFISTIANHKNILLNNAGKYAPEAIRNYVAAAKEITETLHPSNYVSTTSQNVANWSSRMSTAYTNYYNAYNNLTNRTVELTYENLFSLADWRNSDSYAYNSSNGEVIIENDATIKIYKSGAGGELTTGSSYSGNHGASKYSMPVIGGKDYTVRFNITSSVSGTPTSEVFLFWYDVNNKPVYNTAGSNTFNNKSFNGDGVKTATFTVPANAVKCEIRFDNDSATSASTIRFNDIAFYPAERNTEGEVESWTARPFKKLYTLGSTISGKLDVPARTNYEFVGWYIDSNKNGLLDSGETKLTDATGAVIASNVKINESTNLVSEWRSLPLDIGYDNLFSLAEFAKTGSVNPSNAANGTVAYDVMAGTVTVESTANGEVYTTYGSNGYTMDVKPNTEYVFEVDMNGTTSTSNALRGQMFIFCYDANGNGVNGPTQIKNGGETTFADVQHIGEYLATNGTHQIVFRTPANCYKLRVRIGATNVGTKAVYSNIGVYEKAAYDAYAKDYQVIRVPFYVGDTTELKLNPTRAGYTFTGWVDGEGNTITSVAGLKASDTVYATWVQQLKVEFKNYDGESLKIQYVTPGNRAEAPAEPTKNPDEDYEYTFAGWDKDFSNVTADLVVTAKFNNVEHPAELISYTRVSLADCETPGTIRKSCDNCGYAWNDGEAFLDENGEFVPALGHNYVTVVTNSSTGIDGVHTVACNRANCKYGENGKAATITAEHNFIEDTSNPAASATCTKPGETYFKCACLETKTIVGTIDPNKHVNTEIRDAKDAACEVAGYEGDTWCKDCNTKIATGDIIKALEHKYTNYVSNGDATCTADGTKTATCDNGCGKEDKVTDVGSQIPHKYTNYVSNGDAKCGYDGTKTAKCDYNCNVGVDTVTDVGSALEHDFSGAYVTNNNGTHVQKCVNNDCTATGNKKDCEYGAWTKDNAATHSHTCEKCNYTPAAEEHDWSVWTAVGGSSSSEATQTRSCTVCGRVENSECHYVVETHKDATCEAAELTTYRCSDCKHGYTVIGEGAKGHKFEGAVVNHGDGSHSFYCVNNCGEYGFGTTKGTKVPCSDWTYANTEAGKHTATCKACAYVKTENCSGGNATCTAQAVCQYCETAYGAKADHDITGTEKYLKKATDATCIANETYYKYCINCESEFSTETFEKPDSKAAHVYECTDEYLYIATQAKCGVNETYYAYCTNPDCKKSSEDAANIFEKPDTALTHKWGNAVNNNNGTHTETCSNSNTDGWTCDETRDVNCEEWMKPAGVASATCTEQGYTLYECDVCAYTWKDNYVDALGHDYTEKIYDAAHLKEAANCEHANIYYYDCSRCDKNAKDIADGEVYTGQATYYNGEVRAHKWQNKVDAQYLAAEATCNTAAWYYSSCSYEDCAKSSKEIEGDSTTRKFQNGSSLGHDWVKPDKDSADFINYRATTGDCVTNETYYYVCSRADVCKVESSKDSGKDGGETWELEDSKSGHALAHTPAKPADCYNEGNYEHWYCANCKKYFKDADASEAFANENATKIAKRSHDIVKVDYKAPNCIEDGVPEHEYCAYICGYTTLPSNLDAYKATGHNFVGTYVYDKVYLYHSRRCVNDDCDVSGIVVDGRQVEYKVVYDGLDFVIDGGEKCNFTFKAETKDGVHTHNNSCVCGNNTSKTYADDETKVGTVEPTCTTKGYENHECPDCDATWTKNEKPANNHVPAATATSNGNGTHSIKCTVEGCGALISTEKCSGGTATCSAPAVCTICFAEYGAATGDHVLDENAWVVVTEATCYVAKVEKQICSACTEEQTRTVGDALGHDMSEYTYDVPADKAAAAAAVVLPTCAQYGVKVSYCSRCDEFKTYTTMDKGEHEIDFENAEYVEVGNCSTGITYIYTCVCGAKVAKDSGKTGHKFEITVKSYGTCNATGYIVLSCTQCGFSTRVDSTTAGFADGNVPVEGYGDISTADLQLIDHDITNSELVIEKAATCAIKGRGYKVCALCSKAIYEDIDVIKNAHNPDSDENTLRLIKGYAATCTSSGRENYYECVVCSYSQNSDNSKYIPAEGHSDADAEGTCDKCGTAYNAASNKCGCICHKESGFMKFIFKILKFFWKLFGKNAECACGVTHY